MTLAEIANSPTDALAARLDRARVAFENLSANAEKWATLNGRLYVESSDGRDCYVTDGKTCDCADATVGQAAKYLGGSCKHIALHWLIEQEARHFEQQAAAAEDARIHVTYGDAEFWAREWGHLD